MRLRIANLKTIARHDTEMGKVILSSLPGGAVGYDFKEWPRIRVIYINDKEPTK